MCWFLARVGRRQFARAYAPSVRRPSCGSQGRHGEIQPPQRLCGVRDRHRMAKSVMAGSPAVIVKIDALADSRGDEAKHLIALMRNKVAVVARRAGEAEINPKPRPEALDPSGDLVPLEDSIQAK